MVRNPLAMPIRYVLPTWLRYMHAQTYAPLLLIPRTAKVLPVQVQKQYPTLPHTKRKKKLRNIRLAYGYCMERIDFGGLRPIPPLFIEHGGALAKNDQLHG